MPGLGGWEVWPDYHVHFITRRLYLEVLYRVGVPPTWPFHPSSGEVVDLVWLIVFLGLAIRRVCGITQNRPFGVALGLLANLQVIAEIARELWAELHTGGTRSSLVASEGLWNNVTNEARLLAVQALLSLFALSLLSVMGVGLARKPRADFQGLRT